MTGKELIDWIHENNAEDLPVAFEKSCYETFLEEAKPVISIASEDVFDTEDQLRGKKIIELV